MRTAGCLKKMRNQTDHNDGAKTNRAEGQGKVGRNEHGTHPLIEIRGYGHRHELHVLCGWGRGLLLTKKTERVRGELGDGRRGGSAQSRASAAHLRIEYAQLLACHAERKSGQNGLGADLERG